MSEITPFQFEEHAVRVVTLDGDPWFVVVDVCRILGIVDGRDAASRIDPADRVKTPVHSPSRGQDRPTWVVNESGLYELIFASHKPEARKFRRWVTSEVLPQIRRTGSYSAKPMSALDALAASVAMLQEQERRVTAVEQRQESVERMLGQQAAEAAELLAQVQDDVDTLKENHDRVSAIGYANLRKIRSDVEFLRLLGIRASSIARRDGISPSRVHSTVWGDVNAWPMEVWDEAFELIRGRFGL